MATIEKFLIMITPLIEKKNTMMREAINTKEWLTTTLRYLAIGETYENMTFTSAFSPQSFGYIVPETCAALCEVLKNYIRVNRPAKSWVFSFIFHI